MQRTTSNIYTKALVVVTLVTVFLLLIYSHLDWRSEQMTQLSDYRDVEYPQRKDQARKSTSEFVKSRTLSKAVEEVNRVGPSKRTSDASELSSKKKTERKKNDPAFVQPAKHPDKIRVTYPAWFSESWERARTFPHINQFVGDKPLYSGACIKGEDTRPNRFPMIDAPDYLDDSKNPCWWDDPARQRGFHCVPYFYVAGVAKCGTTDLYRRIRLHPEVMKGTMKEYHFWDRERFGGVDYDANGQVVEIHRKPWSFEQYTELVTGARDLRLVADDLKYDGFSIRIFGDGSPSYLWDIQKWDLLEGNDGCAEPRYVIGQHIRHTYPQSKLILIFRHPTPRLYSRFLSRIWRTSYLKGATREDFHKYVVNGVRLYKECFSKMSIRQCAFNITIYDDAVTRLVEGMYPIFMADWLRIWPRDQLLLLRNEDYGQDMNGTLDKVFQFLGASEVTGEAREEVLGHELVNVGSEYETVGPMKPETVKILDKFYQPFVNKLAELLQDERFLWKDTYPPKAGTNDINLAMNGPPSEIAKRQTPSGSSERQDSNSQPVKTQAAPAPRYNVAIAGDRDNPAAAYHPVTQLRKPRPSWASLLLNRSRTSLGLNENGVVQMAKQPGASVVRSRFPDWWLDAWSRSITARLQDQFVGDRPFFPPCITSNKRTGKRPVGMLEPRNYHPSLKNPCWYKDPQLHDGLRCLPYFHVIGVATSGASDLIRRIRMHPDVMKGTMREFHWWDRGRFGDVYKENMPIDNMEESEGLSRIALKDYAYLITGSTGIDSVMADVNSTGKSNKIFGDNSPSYFNDVKYWSLLDGNQGCLEPRLTIGQHIRHTTPDAKIIVIVRHPTPRLYLRFLSRVPEQMSLKKTASFAFHRLVKKSVEMYRDCFSQWSIRQCAYNVSLYEKDKVKLWEGMYSVFLADWLRVFPAEQIHVIRYRDLVRDTNNVMANIFNFLNLPPLNATTKHLMAAEKWAGRREEHELRKYFGPMVPETVDMLNEFYDPFVDKFAELLNDEKFLWRDVDHL